MAKATMPVPTESVEQQCLIRWARMQRGKYPELDLLYHVPNEGKRPSSTGARMRAEGLKKGVPDIVLPVARGGYHGLYIEMKRLKGSKTTEEQKEWIKNLNNQGYFACICKGWEAAKDVIMQYLSLNRGKTEQNQ